MAGAEFDIAQYNNMSHTTGGISVDFALGIVTGDLSNGTDTLRGIEGVQGTNFDDSFRCDRVRQPPTTSMPCSYNVGNIGKYNQFEGMGGDDSITGNGNTRVIYVNAATGVTVDLARDGARHGRRRSRQVGQDTLAAASTALGGSNFDDTLRGSNNCPGNDRAVQRPRRR